MLSNTESKKHAWQQALSDLITDPKELWDILDLDPALLDDAYQVVRQFPLKVPRSFVARMEKGNPHDPLLKQVLPLGAELDVISGFSLHPLQEINANPVPGVLHKYHGRVLVMLTAACAIHCRYCFRRHFPYEENISGRSGWEKIFAYLKQDPGISEVILSGGDPLSVSDHLLKSFTDELVQIPHIKRLRIHTRLAVVIPERITEQFVSWLNDLPLKSVLVTHINHANEINFEVKQALERLRSIGVTLLNQSVLLKEINDNVQTLAILSETLFASGVLPYYLHILDKVQGAAHFDIPLSCAKALHTELSYQLPGYLLPKLVYEQSGKLAKNIL